MKLISCYIEGYGKIKSRSYEFADGITAFCEENGEGKTTLASFIKAMFFGLKSYKKGSTEFCDREHFYPFDGGRFGGNLTFEMKGKTYKIERFFGEKSETADTVKAYENGVETDVLGEEIGKTVFGVDRESFERTLFFGSGDIEIKSTSSIHAQLNRILGGNEDDSNLDDALAALDKAAKVYKKSKAGNDKVTAETLQLARLKEQIDNAETIKRALEEKYERERALRVEVAGLSEKIVLAQEENERLSRFEHLDRLNEGISRLEGQLAEIVSRYPNGLPTETETLEINECIVKDKELKAQASGGEFSPSDAHRLSALEQTFRLGVPTEDRLLSVESEVVAFADLEREMKGGKEKPLSEGEQRLVGTFARTRPSADALAEGKNRVERYKALKAEYEETPAWLQVSAKASGRAFVLFAVLAAVLCLVGGVCCAFLTPLGIVLLVIGGVSLLVDGFLYLNKKSSSGGNVENPNKKKLEGLLQTEEDFIKAMVLPYGYYSGNGVVFDFASLARDVQAYEELLAAQKEEETRVLESAERAEVHRKNLQSFFGAYGLSGDNYIKLLSDLRVNVSDFISLTARRVACERGMEDLQLQRIKNSKKIEEFRAKYGLEELVTNRILEDIRAVCRLQKECEEGRIEATKYQEEKGLFDRNGSEKADLAALQSRLTEIQSEKSRLDREISEDEVVAEKLDDYERDKLLSETRLAEYKRKYRLLTETSALLKKAEGQLLDRYLHPIKEEFLYYARVIENALGEKVVMTKDFELRFERMGSERSEKYLSTGQRSICALCFRLALIKNMYREQRLFLVLDDPFTALDGKHMEKVKGVLQELSKDAQLIYFTCHESRKI